MEQSQLADGSKPCDQIVMVQTLPVSSLLFRNPSSGPRYAVRIRAQDGREILAADPRATRALIALMDMNAVLGGAASHFGGPSALAELMSALHAFMFDTATWAGKDWQELYHFVNDAGHCENGLYALKANYGLAGLTLESLKKFRDISSPLTGHGEVHCFPQGVFLSNGPLGSAFPQSQGLAIGEKISGKNRTTFCVISDGASMEGEAREAFAAIPGLARVGKCAPYVLIISDNNTKLSGRIDEESFSMAPTFRALGHLGWDVLELADAHNLQKCFDVIAEAAQRVSLDPTRPVALSLIH
ncbi:MAG: thiamine pyrophosphate-dependent enzyme, partial [Bdellovibrionaceae bacterium]|nr:thiamine pyrophosphate-dependent enzyme [Pseudobdellovibrionaceae bacterium]